MYKGACQKATVTSIIITHKNKKKRGGGGTSLYLKTSSECMIFWYHNILLLRSENYRFSYIRFKAYALISLEESWSQSEKQTNYTA